MSALIQRHEVQSYAVDIFIAGSVADATRTCRQHCYEVGLCVHLVPAEFIYTAGAEHGVKVGLVNYPRFPSEPTALFDRAVVLAERLMDDLSQWSALVQAPDRTLWLTRRPEGK